MFYLQYYTARYNLGDHARAKDRTTRGVSQKFFMRVYLLFCLVLEKILKKCLTNSHRLSHNAISNPPVLHKPPQRGRSQAPQ